MHNFLAGIMSFFVGLGAMFHGGGATPPSANQTQMMQQSIISGTPASPSGMMRGNFRRMNIPAGERAFLGTVTSVNGSTLTLQSTTMMMHRRNDDENTPSITPRTTQTLTIMLDSSTKYIGGAQSDISTNTKIAGFGKTNSDGSITAVNVRINPTVPSGFPRRERPADDQ